jgi:hypothetical protein
VPLTPGPLSCMYLAIEAGPDSARMTGKPEVINLDFVFREAQHPSVRLTQEETTQARCRCYEEPGGRVPLSAGAW